MQFMVKIQKRNWKRILTKVGTGPVKKKLQFRNTDLIMALWSGIYPTKQANPMKVSYFVITDRVHRLLCPQSYSPPRKNRRHDYEPNLRQLNLMWAKPKLFKTLVSG